jgi:hypothetical protein
MAARNIGRGALDYFKEMIKNNLRGKEKMILEG